MMEEQQQDEREQLHTLKRKQQHKNTYPKRNKKSGHDAKYQLHNCVTQH